MASRAPARVPQSKAVIPATLSDDDLRALLGQTGELATGGQYHRMTLKAGVLTTDDGDMFVPRKDAAACVVRIVKPPAYFNAIFLSEKDERGSFDARQIGRPDLNGRFARKYDDPNEQAADRNEANAYYDQISEMIGSRGSFKGEMIVQIAPPDGNFTGDETEYSLTLATTSVFEWRGTSRNQFAGSVSDDNFLVRLATLARADAIEAGADEAGQKQAVLNAMTALRVGNVIAEIWPTQASGDGKDWWVLKFVPIHIAPFEEAPALEAGDPATGDDVPF